MAAAATCGSGSAAAAGCSRSATAARRPTRWTSSPTSATRRRGGRRGRAIDLTEDPAILTAIANDIGAEAMFSRQVIAHGRAGDVLLAISTPGGSANVIEALAEARRRGLGTIALVGYDGGRVAAEGLADHVVISRSEHIPRIQEAQASAYHVLRELVDGPPRRERGPSTARRARRASRAPCRASGSAPTSTGWRGELGLAGFVLNDSRGVLVEVEGDADVVDRFLARLRAEAPPLAVVERCRARNARRLGETGFPIVESPPAASRERRSRRTAATCGDCLRELLDPADRRHRYPFINCTNCGPRFTIVRGVPYDRPLTTMAGFAMCAACQAEYDDPGDRRFHAQPNACPAAGRRCGCCAATARGATAAGTRVAAARGAAGGRDRRHQGHRRVPPCLPRRRRGAVAELRARKHREDKPFALMAAASRPRAQRWSCSARPRRRCSAPRAADRARAAPPRRAVAAAVAPGAPELGVMLPYSPLHHLLLADAGAPLVMTSGNVSDEPIAYRDDGRARAARRDRRPAAGARPADRDAHRRLGRARRRAAPAADAAPLARLRARARRCRRRAPGRSWPAAPSRRTPSASPRATRAWVGHHVGDLENYETLRSFIDGIDALRAPVRGDARDRRPRPPPGVPVDQVRARARRRGARSASSTTTPTSPRPGRARGAGPAVGRSSTARGTGATARSGAASCWSATRRLPAGGPPAAGAHAGRRPGRAPAVADGMRMARRDRRAGPPPALTARRRGAAGSRCGALPFRPRLAAVRPAWAGCSTRSPRCAACAPRCTTRARRRSSSRRWRTPPSAPRTRSTSSRPAAA